MFRLFQFCCGFSSLAGLVTDDAALKGRKFPFGSGRDRGGEQRRRCRLTGTLALCLLSAMPAGISRAAEPEFDIDIPAMNAAEALNRLAEQTGSVMLFSYDLARAREANAVRGRYTLLEGLELLLRDTGLLGGLSDKRVVVIAEEGNMPSGKGESVKKRGLFAGIIAVLTGVASIDVHADQETDDKSAAQLSEIVVTGTHLRNVVPAGSLVIILDREAIDNSGSATAGELLRTLPQNSGAGQSESAARNSAGDASITNGDAVNLRGLGVGSTLTLLDGYRLAPAGFGDFVDISMIPLSAVERVEVLPDGASAVYGSDAVAGVVNFIMRDKFDGAETRARYGSSSEGDATEYLVSQALGHSWATGNVLGSYEYYERDELDANDRSFTSSATEPYDLLPRQIRHSALIAASQRLGADTEFFSRGLFSNRESRQSTNTFSGTTPFSYDSEVEQYGGVVGFRHGFSRDWRLAIAGLYDENSTDFVSEFIGCCIAADTKLISNIWSIDAKADGPVLDAPGGEIRLAIGMNYRSEELDTIDRLSTTDPSRQNRGQRDVVAAYAELNVPIVGETNGSRGIARLDLEIAARYEDYSDFGDTFDPKIGISWSPVKGMRFRSTYSTSFRAPIFDQLNDSGNIAIVFPIPDLSGAPVNTFLVTGQNSALQPETSTSWTAGFDIDPPQLPGFSARLTYFNVEYKDRIGRAFSDFFLIFAESQFAGPYFVANPEEAFLQGQIAQVPLFIDTGVPLSDVGAFADLRLQNLATTELDGLDVELSFQDSIGAGDVGLTIGGQVLFNDRRQSTELAPAINVDDTVFNSLSLKLRSSIWWKRNDWAITLFGNYVDEYSDVRVVPAAVVDSWFTADLTVAYELGRESGRPLRLILSARNLFDEDPPFVDDPTNGLNFDGANANPLGRFISFQLSKTW